MRPTGKEAATPKGDEQSGGRDGQSPGSAHASSQSRKGSPHPRNLTSPATEEATDVGTPALSALSPRPTREPSMLINVRNVWADEAAAAAGRLSLGEEAASPRWSASHQEAPSSEFWRPPHMFRDYVLQRSSGIHEIGAMRSELLVFMTVVWVIVFGVSSQKPDVVHAVYQALFWVAMLCFVPFMVHSTYQHFTIRGLIKILTPDLAVLASSKVWLDAAEHSLFSLGTSSGLVFFLGSRCKYGSCFERCAAWTIVAEMTACDLIALTTCFWIYKPGNTEHEITPAVPFTFRQLVTTAQLVVSCVSPTICNVLVFTSFVATGLAANVLLVKTCVAEITAVLNYATSGAYTWTLVVVCGLAYACSIPFCTKGGLYIQNVFEQGLARNLFFIVSLLQVISLVWFYGVRRLCFDLEYMLKDPVGIYWVYCWAFSAPAILVVCAAVYVSEGAGSASLTIGDYEYPPWVAMFMWVSSGVSLLPVPVMALRHWLRLDMDFTKALGTDPMWGPQDPDLTFDYNDRIRTLVTITPVKGKNVAKDKGGFNRTPVLFTASSSFTALHNQLSLE